MVHIFTFLVCMKQKVNLWTKMRKKNPLKMKRFKMKKLTIGLPIDHFLYGKIIIQNWHQILFHHYSIRLGKGTEEARLVSSLRKVLEFLKGLRELQQENNHVNTNSKNIKVFCINTHRSKLNYESSHIE